MVGFEIPQINSLSVSKIKMTMIHHKHEIDIFIWALLQEDKSKSSPKIVKLNLQNEINS